MSVAGKRPLISSSLSAPFSSYGLLRIFSSLQEKNYLRWLAIARAQPREYEKRTKAGERRQIEQGMGIFCAEPGSALSNTTLAAAILKRDRRR
jgi:hypothetical protein